MSLPRLVVAAPSTGQGKTTIATGLIFMVCVLLFRRGIVGEIYAKLTSARN